MCYASAMFGRLVTIQHQSKCLQGNRLGDPHERELYVYLPPEYDDKQRYPVVILLAGFGSTHHSIVAWDPWKPNTVELFDQIIAAGGCKPALLVLPDCFNRWGGSQFLDSEATGAYQTYLADEIIPTIDKEFRTIPKREARAIAGRSSGGFGALRLAIDRPETVSVVGAHAADAAFEISMRGMLNNTAIAINAAGGLKAFAERVPLGGPQNAMEFDALFVLAASAAYAPLPQQGFPFTQLPIDLQSGELKQDIWAEWLKNDPLERLRNTPTLLQDMNLVFIDAGAQDEHGLQFAAQQLAQVLNKAGAKVHHEAYEGGHRGTSWRYEVSLPMMIDQLASTS